MEFAFTAAEAAFAEEVRGFLRDNPVERFPLDGMDAGYGSGAHSRAFMQALAARGWIGMCWPAAFGGQARPMFEKLVLFEELALAGAPFGPLAGSWQTADAIIEYGSERLRREVLPAVGRGEATFWQGYSEPDAGSDLLALKTEARRDGDHYVIRGHKIWSSHAGIATHGLVFCRTSREARRSQGNILIPAFAVGRSQELIYFLKHHGREWGIDQWTIFLDSPMAIEATEVYARHWKLFDAETARRRKKDGDTFTMPNLHFSRTAAQSMAINRVRAGAIVIAGSGMCDGGRIRHHFKHNLWREQCHVIFAGFQARGTLGRQLVDGAKTVKLWDETIRVAAQIHTVGGLSAHAGQSGLLNWYRNFERHPAVALVHGEPEPMDALAKRLRILRASVLIPEAGERIDLLSLPRAR